MDLNNPLIRFPKDFKRWNDIRIDEAETIRIERERMEKKEKAKQLRKEMTKEERHLWYDFLRSYPVRFSRQKVLGKYIADFYSAEAKLVIELDGSQHYEDTNIETDKERTAFLENYGLTVIRIPNNEINKNFYGVCEYIDFAVNFNERYETLTIPVQPSG